MTIKTTRDLLDRLYAEKLLTWDELNLVAHALNTRTGGILKNAPSLRDKPVAWAVWQGWMAHIAPSRVSQTLIIVSGDERTPFLKTHAILDTVAIKTLTAWTEGLRWNLQAMRLPRPLDEMDEAAWETVFTAIKTVRAKSAAHSNNKETAA